MAGNLKVNAPKVSGSGRVGLPPTVLNALRWAANSNPAVVKIDADIAAIRADPGFGTADSLRRVQELKAAREVAVAAAVRELVG